MTGIVTQLRKIIHDWPDSEAAAILKNVASAMTPHSRLLIGVFVYPLCLVFTCLTCRVLIRRLRPAPCQQR